MKRSVALSLLCVVIVFTSIKVRSVSQEQESKPGNLQALVERARAKGEQEISVPTGVINEYPMAKDLDEALSSYNLVIATLSGKESFVTESQDIRTWYKFKIVETLHRVAQKDDCSSCELSLAPPKSMLPLAEDEFLVLRDGGMVQIDGMKITSYEPQFPELSLSKRYLLFISPTSSEKSNALKMGPHGIQSIDDRERIEPIIKEVGRQLNDDIRQLWGGSMTQVRSNLRPRIAQ
jgi:hypothetical protein